MLAYSPVFDTDVTQTCRAARNTVAVIRKHQTVNGSLKISVTSFFKDCGHAAAFGYPQCTWAHLLSSVDASTVQFVDVVLALVHEAADQPVIAEDDAGHLGDVLAALVLGDVGAVFYQTRHQVTLPTLLTRTLLNLQTDLDYSESVVQSEIEVCFRAHLPH